MRKILTPTTLVLFSLLFAGESHGQEIQIGARGGISIPNLTSGSGGTPVSRGYKSRQGPDFALYAEYSISPLISIKASLEYSSQGGKKSGVQAIPVGSDYVYANFKSEAKLNYLLIPVLANFSFPFGADDQWKFYAGAGPFIGFLMSAKGVTKGTSMVYEDEAETMPLPYGDVKFDSSMSIKNQLKSTNAGIEASVGLMYRFGPHAVFFEAGGNYGFINVQKDKANGQNNIGAACFTLGYAYTLRSFKPR